MKTIGIPVQNYVNDGNTLTEWLGHFWNRLYENPEFTNSLQQGQGLLSAQLYLNYLENLNLRDRNSVPVFHRERWKPMVIRKSQAGTGKGSILKLGMVPTPVLGPQTGNTFVPGQVFTLGGSAAFANAVSYPFEGAEEIMTCITDNIVAPTTVLVQGVDFIVQDSTVFFLRTCDPFDLGFARRGFINETGEADQEIILWASDVLIDEQYVYNFLGYVLNTKTASTEFYQTMLNSLWTVYNDGTPLKLLYTVIGAMLGEPTIVSAQETIEQIFDQDSFKLVVTDKRVYKVSLAATLRSKVIPGAIMASGEFLTESIRIYDTLDPMKLNAVSEYGDRLKTDVSSLFFDPTLIKSRLNFGIGATWDTVDIVSAGPDINGKAKLKFKLYGNLDDIDTFWSDFWTYLEQNGMSSQTCFSDYVGDIVLPATEGTIYGKVQPLEYFMRYFLKANAFIVVIDHDTLTAPPTDMDPIGLLSILNRLIPAHVMMLIVERRDAGEELYDLADLGSNPLQCKARFVTDEAYYGLPTKTKLTYVDCRPKMRWVKTCK